MRKLRLLWICALLCPVLGAVPTKDKRADRIIPNLNTPIRVLLDKETSHGAVRSNHAQLYVSEADGRWTKTGPLLKLHVEMVKGKPALFQDERALKGKTLYVRGGPLASDILEYKGKKYRGALRISLKKNRFNVTNVLPLEDYLEGMLASEMSPSWDIEALKAQAVAARSYALYMMRHPKDASYDLESGTQDQVYGGVEKESAKVRSAVRETAQMYLGIDGEPVKAFFHSRCGGSTETAQTVWRYPNAAHKSRVPCPYCQKKRATWQAIIPKESFFRNLRMPYEKGEPIRIFPSVTPTGRIAELSVQTTSGQRRVSSDEFRSLLGYTTIKSAFFDWKIGKDDIYFEGKGNGHGVGMCQWGAKQFATEGKSFKQILVHFYPDALLYEKGHTVAVTAP